MNQELIDGVRRICDRYCSRGTPDVAIEETITLILSAVHDGRLKLPGEVGRCTRAHVVEFGPDFADWIDHTINFHGARTFIVLSPAEEER